MDSQDTTSLVRSLIEDIILNLPYQEVIDLTTRLPLNLMVPLKDLLSSINDSFNYLDMMIDEHLNEEWSFDHDLWESLDQEEEEEDNLSIVTINEVADKEIESDNENNSIQIVYDYIVI